MIDREIACTYISRGKANTVRDDREQFLNCGHERAPVHVLYFGKWSSGKSLDQSRYLCCEWQPTIVIVYRVI